MHLWVPGSRIVLRRMESVVMSGSSLSKENLIATITRILSKYPRVSFAYLFGSANKDKLLPFSDIDIAVHIIDFDQNEQKDLKYYLHLKIALEDEIGRQVDLIVLNEASTLLKKEVLLGGTRIWDMNEELSRAFHLRTVWEYEDVRPYLDYQFRRALRYLDEKGQ